MEKLFSYGTLQLEQVQLETFGRKLEGRKDQLVGYVLGEVEITDPHVVAASGERFHPILRYTGQSADRVAGTVFEITSQELAQSDEYEVDEYQRIEARLLSGITCWIYGEA